VRYREDDHLLPRVADKPDHIFVSMASYRDERCKITLADLFAKAAQPERITSRSCSPKIDPSQPAFGVAE
jgi:hypothetical protein